MIKGTMLTGTDTLTITNTRTVMERYWKYSTYPCFTTGIDYAFESPNNTH